MLRPLTVLPLLLGVVLYGCGGSEPVDNATPVVTPTVMMSSSTLASGSPVDFTFRFAVAPDAPAFGGNYSVFVHVLDEDGRMIGAEDHDPPTPTRSWTAGSTVEYTRSTWAPTTRYTGPATVVVGLYSRATGERVPVAGEALEPRAVKVATFEMRERTDPYGVVYREGWHAVESPKGSGVEWRWSMKSGALAFPNPTRDVELVLQLDQPASVFPIPQHVEVQVGDVVADAFDLEAGRTELRRIALSPAQLGSGQTVELAIVSDKTFVPAEVPALKSPDTRRLGVRVFRAYVEPKQ